MAKLHLAQIAYLSQQLIHQVKNANNLIARGKFELDLVQQTVKSLMTVYEELEKDEGDDQQ